MKTIRGTIQFLRTDEGGRLSAPQNGVRSLLLLGEVLTSVVVRGAAGENAFELGIEYHVYIDIPFWDQYGNLFDARLPLELYEGNKIVAKGRFD